MSPRSPSTAGGIRGARGRVRQGKPAQPASMTRGRKLAAAVAVSALAPLAAALAAFLVHAETLRFDFLSWDDSHYVTQNPWIRSWSYENLRHLFTHTYFVSYMPLQLLSYVLDFSLWGLRPFGYHLQNVILDAVNAFLAFWVVRRLFGRTTLAFLTALLFAAHPSHVESVAWVSARKELLSTAFLLPSVYLYVKAREGRTLGFGPYLWSVAFFSLAVLAKVNVVVMPLFLVLVDLFAVKLAARGRPFWFQTLGTKVPYGLVGMAVAVVNWIAQAKSKAEYARDPLRYLILKGHAVWNYLGLLTGFPRPNPIYDTPPIPVASAMAGVQLTGLLVLPLVVWIAYRRHLRVLGLGAGWIFVMLLPAIFFPVLTYIADRYLYAPSLGFCWLLGAGILVLPKRLAGLITPRAILTAALAVLPIGFFAHRTIQYDRVWTNSERLWSYTVERSIDFRAYNNLARVRMDQKRWDEAERLFRLGARQPNVTSWEGLTAVYYLTGRYAEALQANDRSLALHSRNANDSAELAELQYKRGAVLWAQSKPEEAVAAWQASLRANPTHADARKMLDVARQAGFMR